MNTLLYLLPIISVILLAGARLLEIRTKRAEVIKGPVKEHLTFQLFVAVGGLIAFCSILEYVLAGHGFRWWLFVPGWAIGLLSFYIRRAAIASLGRFWSLHVEIRDNHEFVNTGPFRYVRHPVYFSMVLELLAFAVLCGSWITGVAIPILYVPVLLRRVNLEEKAMIEKFGPKYEDYRRTTPAIIPGLW